MDGHDAVLVQEIVPWQDLPDRGEQGSRGQDEPDRQDVPQRLDVQPPLYRTCGQDCLQLGAEVQALGGRGVDQRLDAEAVAREHEPAPAGVPQGEAEHAAEALDAVDAQLLVEVDDDLDVRALRKRCPPAASSSRSSRKL